MSRFLKALKTLNSYQTNGNSTTFNSSSPSSPSSLTKEEQEEQERKNISLGDVPLLSLSSSASSSTSSSSSSTSPTTGKGKKGNGKSGGEGEKKLLPIVPKKRGRPKKNKQADNLNLLGVVQADQCEPDIYTEWCCPNAFTLHKIFVLFKNAKAEHIVFSIDYTVLNIYAVDNQDVAIASARIEGQKTKKYYTEGKYSISFSAHTFYKNITKTVSNGHIEFIFQTFKGSYKEKAAIMLKGGARIHGNPVKEISISMYDVSKIQFPVNVLSTTTANIQFTTTSEHMKDIVGHVSTGDAYVQFMATPKSLQFSAKTPSNDVKSKTPIDISKVNYKFYSPNMEEKENQIYAVSIKHASLIPIKGCLFKDNNMVASYYEDDKFLFSTELHGGEIMLKYVILFSSKQKTKTVSDEQKVIEEKDNKKIIAEEDADVLKNKMEGEEEEDEDYKREREMNGEFSDDDILGI